MTDPLEFAELMENLEIEIRMVEGNGLASVTDALMSIREILKILAKEKS